jgi:hypothetical protein
MKVQYTDAAAPAKRGTTEHLPVHVAASLIAAGFAVATPVPVRGSKEWLEARLEQSKMAGPPDPHDVDPSAMQRAIDDKFKTERPNFPFVKQK